MSKKLFRLLALLLTFGILAGAVAAPVAAADAPAKKAYVNPNGCKPSKPCKYSPTIILPGISQSETELYRDGEPTGLKGGTVFPDTENMDLAPVVLSLLASLFLQHDVFLTKSVYSLVSGVLEPQRVDNGGNFVHDLRTKVIGRVSEMSEGERHTALDVNVPMYEVMERVGDDHVYFFAFNLVDDVWNNVDALEKYIDSVRKETGHGKVNLVGVSLGGTLITGYLERYGHKKLDQIVNVVSCSDGTDMFADLFSHKVNRNEDFLYRNWIPTLMDDELGVAEGWDKTIGYGADLLIRMFPNKVFEGIISAAWAAVMDTVLVNCTQFWAMIPCDRYDETAKLHLSGPDKAEVKKKADAYHQAQLNLAKNVLAAKRAGVHINNIAGANLYFGEGRYTYFQAVESIDTVNGDGIIGVRCAGMGATGAAPGKTLAEEGYVPKTKKYLSPDGKVDCSTCVLPDNTWIFLGQEHEVGRNDAVLHLASAFIKNPGMTVHTDPKHFPQFNYGMDTNDLRRGRLDDAKKLLAEGDLAAADKAELQAAIKEGQAVRALSIGDAKRAEEATEALNAILVKHGWRGEPYQQSSAQKNMEAFMAYLSQMALHYYGNNGFIEGGSLKRFWGKMLG
ncbi:MAG: alpha/beta hydrolase [Oscillospiraceae bacterium]|jgi:hypothetical protein|nr:alpha/beta hydrolase [Oscillospiraceae bacterium]